MEVLTGIPSPTLEEWGSDGDAALGVESIGYNFTLTGTESSRGEKEILLMNCFMKVSNSNFQRRLSGLEKVN